jgi:hypothetical protein
LYSFVAPELALRGRFRESVIQVLSQGHKMRQLTVQTIPPEVLFDRFFQSRFPFVPPVVPGNPDTRVYKGRDDLMSLPGPLQEALRNIQTDFKRALQHANERQEIQSGQFHFDYIKSDFQNALAFRYRDHSFIGMTIPLLLQFDATCKKLCGAESV